MSAIYYQALSLAEEFNKDFADLVNMITKYGYNNTLIKLLEEE